jgi:hypothetical protein
VLTLANVIHPGANTGARPFAHELAKPGLRAHVTGFEPSLQLAAAASSESQSATPAKAPAGAEVLLPKFLPVSTVVDAVRLSPRIGSFDSVEAGTGLQALSAVGEAFTLADMEPSPRMPELIAPRPALMLPEPALADLATPNLRASVAQVPDLRWAVLQPAPATLDPAPFQNGLAIIGELSKPDTSEFEFADFSCSAAGFADEEWPAPYFGVFRPQSDSCDFSLQPVWLASLFILGHPRVGSRPCGPRDLKGFRPAAFFNNVPAPGNGPGFSGMLALPKSDAPAEEFGEYRTPAAARPQPQRDVRPAKTPWLKALRLWRSVPRFARGLAVAITLIAPAMFYVPTIHWPHLSTDQAALMAAIQARAQIDLREDFQAGLGAWTGPKGWESTWVMDSPGGAQPGRLALYQPLTPLTDYHLELQGQILSKALGFVFRATDINNYYAASIAIRKPGPLPSVYLVRYPVIGGRAGQKTETLLPMYLRTDTLYDVLVTVQGDNFTITVNGQLVDTWSDSRLKSGGVGLFAEKGEISQVRSVHVTENEDFLGMVCSQVSHWNADRARIGVKHE